MSDRKHAAGAFEGKVALVVGGTRGIGGAISRRLASGGASVGMIHLSRSAEAGDLSGDLRRAGADAVAVQADVADPVALAQAIDTIVSRLGRHCSPECPAGLAIVGPLEDYPDDAFDRIFSVNVRAVFLAAQKAARIMERGGRIITIGSIVADRMPGPGGTLYAASKSALAGLTRGLARDLASREITVNLVQPGPIDTERNPADGPNAAANRTPLALQRHGTVAEVAELVAYLASDAAAFVTGATYNIDGGWSA